MIVLFLNSIAGSEIVIILLFVLIFFGAKSIPGMSRALGRGIRQIKDASQEVQDEIRKSTKDMRSDMGVRQTIEQASNQLKAPMKDMAKGIEESTTSMQEKVVVPGSIPHIRKQVNKSAQEKEEPADENRATIPEQNSNLSSSDVKPSKEEVKSKKSEDKDDH
jgi:sec-independent protein translocase protein TatA